MWCGEGVNLSHFQFEYLKEKVFFGGNYFLGAISIFSRPSTESYNVYLFSGKRDPSVPIDTQTNILLLLHKNETYDGYTGTTILSVTVTYYYKHFRIDTQTNIPKYL